MTQAAVKAEKKERGITASASGRQQYGREQTFLALSTVMRERHTRMPGTFLWITVTYNDRNHWKGKQISGFLKSFKKAIKETSANKAMIVWRLENGKNATTTPNIHYHIMVHLPEGLKAISGSRVKACWKYGQQVKVEQIECKDACRKVATYMGKEDRNASLLPHDTRILGNSGLNHLEKARLEWLRGPAWMRKVFREEEQPMPCREGGGYYSKVTGEQIPSPCTYNAKTGDFVFKSAKALGPSWATQERLAILEELKQEAQRRREQRKELDRKRAAKAKMAEEDAVQEAEIRSRGQVIDSDKGKNRPTQRRLTQEIRHRLHLRMMFLIERASRTPPPYHHSSHAVPRGWNAPMVGVMP